MAIFQQNPKGLTLLFGQKLDLFKNGNFSAKSQGVNLTFWPKTKMAIFQQNPKGLTSSKMAIFQQNPKGLTLLFSQKLDLFKNGNFSAKSQEVNLTFWPKIGPILKNGNFSAKSQGVNLTFWPKIGPLQKWQFFSKIPRG